LVPLAKKCSKGKIFAIEALPYYAAVLKITLKLLGLQDVLLFNKAVSSISGKLSLKYKDGSEKLLTGMIHISPSGNERGSVDVECITLDQFIFDQKISIVDFLLKLM
jgi:FkbM family methyltransferase